MKTTKKMGREELVASYVEHRVAKWGEAERAGIVAQAAKKSTAALRADYELDHDLEATGPTTNFIARGNLDRGHS